jgi:hypothetical protein
MQGVLEPALVDGALFSTLSQLNNRVAAGFTAMETRKISSAAGNSCIDSVVACVVWNFQLVCVVISVGSSRPGGGIGWYHTRSHTFHYYDSAIF